MPPRQAGFISCTVLTMSCISGLGDVPACVPPSPFIPSAPCHPELVEGSCDPRRKDSSLLRSSEGQERNQRAAAKRGDQAMPRPPGKGAKKPRTVGTISIISPISQFRAVQIFTSESVDTFSLRPIFAISAELTPAACCKSFFFISKSIHKEDCLNRQPSLLF